MRIEDLIIGESVVLTDTEENGTVADIDYDGYIVYVDVELPDGRTDLMDIDPGDLRPS